MGGGERKVRSQSTILEKLPLSMLIMPHIDTIRNNQISWPGR